LSVHLRFGTVAIRQLARLAYPLAVKGDAGAQTWLSELIWRDFYHQIMHHHPHAMTSSFKVDYDAIEWEKGKTGKALFEAWCEGRTGYPWSMPPWRKSTRPATCTTACAWWWRVFW
jgi:deoxyribodipyrimidine photo-lyase